MWLADRALSLSNRLKQSIQRPRIWPDSNHPCHRARVILPAPNSCSVTLIECYLNKQLKVYILLHKTSVKFINSTPEMLQNTEHTPPDTVSKCTRLRWYLVNFIIFIIYFLDRCNFCENMKPEFYYCTQSDVSEHTDVQRSARTGSLDLIKLCAHTYKHKTTSV